LNDSFLTTIHPEDSVEEDEFEDVECKEEMEEARDEDKPRVELLVAT